MSFSALAQLHICFHGVEPRHHHREMRLMDHGNQANVAKLKASPDRSQLIQKVFDLLAKVHFLKQQEPEPGRLKEQDVVEVPERPIARQAVQDSVEVDDDLGELALVFPIEKPLAGALQFLDFIDQIVGDRQRG
jgi:hypothetical protein